MRKQRKSYTYHSEGSDSDPTAIENYSNVSYLCRNREAPSRHASTSGLEPPPAALAPSDGMRKGRAVTGTPLDVVSVHGVARSQRPKLANREAPIGAAVPTAPRELDLSPGAVPSPT